jgi:hypothetical protein
MPQYSIEVDTCQRCGSRVYVGVETQYSSPGHPVGRVIHWVRCWRGCTGRGVLGRIRRAG